MKKLYLIDGSWYLYRAYYAFPEMPDKDWHNINVVYGFFRMIMKLFHDKPDYLVIARDAPTKTHRHEAYPEYKANRTKVPDDFKSQIPIVQHVAKQLGIPSLVLPWYEADDIMASMAIKYKADKELTSNIFTSDKDLKQLIDDNVFITDPWKWITSKTKDFIQEFLFEPKYILDYLSLIGDAADNIKWVAGIWPKWASTLIKKYKTIENIYKAIDEAAESWNKNIEWISSWIKDKLIAGREDAFEAKWLIELEVVPDKELWDIEDRKFEIDFDKYKQILVQDQNFTTMNKAITELKNKFHMPQQSSLF